ETGTRGAAPRRVALRGPEAEQTDRTGGEHRRTDEPPGEDDRRGEPTREGSASYPPSISIRSAVSARSIDCLGLLVVSAARVGPGWWIVGLGLSPMPGRLALARRGASS